MTTENFSSRDLPQQSSLELGMQDLARLVRTANRFACSVVLCQGQRRVDGKSLEAVTGLTLGQAEPIVIETWGTDACECLWALSSIITGGPSLAEANKRLALGACP
jgi:phosphotransferase system HPr-like phosphotransfer protein